MKTQGLETVFKEATQRHESLGLLYSQWSFDKELIAKALQNIVSIFPHYSRHDASHSRQIIVNIERMLGDRITKLTATDMWLLLESAYSHDIGMVITQKQINDMDSPAFREYVEDLAHDPSNDLSGFASKWLAEKLELPVNKCTHAVFDEYKQLLAEWYRKKHPETAENIVLNPFDEIGLSSPRNELLPKRLFAALGAICRSHGQSFEEVMKLPFSEAGMGTEDCHPRYVACLLRMGDLLDIDDNRFCPVMMRMSGVELPHTSHIHHEKHQSIKHFRLDAERIKIQVACPTPDSYEVAHDWFRWLEQEYHNQSQHWPKIVPSKKLGRLPTLAPPKVILNSPYITLSEGRRPSFEMDKDAILTLLRGTGLYESKFDSIREILQNAVDSTLLWIWHEHADVVVASDPLSFELKELYSECRVVVDFEDAPGSGKVRLRIKDSGMGISRSDLSKMMMVGGSGRNLEKVRAIRKMPVWYRPAGNFGIGLQSIYLLADTFRVITRSRLTHECFKLEFNAKGRSPLVITQLNPEEASYGAMVEVDVAVEEFPVQFMGRVLRRDEHLREKLRSYDFTKKESNLADYEKIQIIGALNSFNAGSPIKLAMGSKELEFEEGDPYYCKETNVILRSIRFEASRFQRPQTCFRGQPFDGLNLNLGFLNGVIDFYGKQALGFVSYSRDFIVSEAVAEARRLAVTSVVAYIKTNYDKLAREEKPYAAAVMIMQGEGRSDSRFIKDVMRVSLDIAHDETMQLGDYIKQVIAKKINYTIFEDPWDLEEEHYSNAFVVHGGSHFCSLVRCVATMRGLYWCDRQSGSIESANDWATEDVFPVSKELLEMLMRGNEDYQVGRRLLFPCWAEYRDLAISNNMPWARIHRHVSCQDDYLVFPFVFDWGRPAVACVDEELIQWVYDNRKHVGVSMDAIRLLYDSLVANIEARVDIKG